MQKTILCYGESNVWGRNPADRSRFPPHVRWPGVLQEHMGKDYRIIEEGLPGRTTMHDDPIDGPSKNGKTYLEPCLFSHAPLDLVILMLGSNDMKKRFSFSAHDIAAGIEKLILLIQQSGTGSEEEAPPILLVSPVPFGPQFTEARYEGAEAIQHHLFPLFQQLAKQYECAVLESGKFVMASPLDSIHLDAEGHHKLGTAIAAMVHILMT